MPFSIKTMLAVVAVLARMTAADSGASTVDKRQTAPQGECNCAEGEICVTGPSTDLGNTFQRVCIPDIMKRQTAPQGECNCAEGEICVTGPSTDLGNTFQRVCIPDIRKRQTAPQGECNCAEGEICVAGPSTDLGNTFELVCIPDIRKRQGLPLSDCGVECPEGMSCVGDQFLGTARCVPSSQKRQLAVAQEKRQLEDVATDPNFGKRQGLVSPPACDFECPEGMECVSNPVLGSLGCVTSSQKRQLAVAQEARQLEAVAADVRKRQSSALTE